MKNLVLALGFSLVAAPHAFATTFPLRDGKIEINLNGGTGENAGSVNLNLSYADAAKTVVRIQGDGRNGGHTFAVDQTAPLAQLKQLNIYAAGGDGYTGSSGRSGQDGQNGRDGETGRWGSDGCPPGNGQRGGDGTNGTDGTNGGPGGPGGPGGDGGTVRVTTSSDQSELLLLVRATVAAGEGGHGGYGGRAGVGGRGGHGGQGGNGGRNTCKDAQGHPTNGPSGSRGWNGSDGRSGSDGRRGSDGPSGPAGRNGSFALVNTDASGSREYAHAFHLVIKSIQALDDNEDTVVEPGEAVHVTAITIANTGPMPTPAGQTLNLSFSPTTTLVPKAAAPVAITDVIPGNGVKTLTFAKGQLVFQAPDKPELVGKDTFLATAIGINSFAIASADATGLGIHWPVGVSGAASGASTYFEATKTLSFTLKNVSSRDVGPSGEQPVDVEYAWTSKDVPGADVTATLPDGRQVTLGSPIVVSDYTVPAKGQLALPVSLTVKNSKGLYAASGTLKVTLKLKDENGNGQDLVDSASTAIGLVADFRAVAFSRHIDLSNANIYCRFPHRLLQTLQISELDLSKRAGSETVTMQIQRKGFLSDGTSPAHTIGTFDFGPYGSLTRGANPNVVLAFLNRLYASASQKDEDTWQMQGGSCAVGQQ